MLCAGAAGALGQLATQRARAQLAADGAALAAAVENTIAGTGHPAELADRYAALNGAEVVSCSCAVGAPTVVVEVEVDGVRATAGAAVDPTHLGPAAGASGMNPRLAGALERLIGASGGALRLGSGVRDHAEQERLWAAALERYGDPEIADDWVARPGSSMHEAGLAADLSGDLDLAARLIERLDLPLYTPLSNEPWHFELVGSRG